MGSSSRVAPSRQRGQVFLLAVLVLGILVATVAFRFARSVNAAAASNQKTESALALARDALLGHAAADATRPGQLPCPDTNNDGFADSCAAVGAATSVRIGRIPWKTLKLSDLRDGSGESLWYAVSRNFAATSIINSDTAAEYAVTGMVPHSNVVAVVFAPGSVVGTQSRDATITLCSTTGTARARNLCAANYLEGGNDNGDASFVSALPTDAFNDRLLVITHDALMKRVLQRVANHARKVLLDYYTTNSFFPTANSYADASERCTATTYQGRFALPSTTITKTGLCTDAITWTGANLDSWFRNNLWNRYVFYSVSPSCTSAATAATCATGGSLTVIGGSTSLRALLIPTGRAYTGQNRPCASAADCLEDAENTNGDSTFVTPVPSSTSNDQLFIVSP